MVGSLDSGAALSYRLCRVRLIDLMQTKLVHLLKTEYLYYKHKIQNTNVQNNVPNFVHD
jgi:hypothetical protein